MRRLVCLIFSLLLMSFATVALSDVPKLPSRTTFSLGYDRMQSALENGRAVQFNVTLVPTTLSGFEGNTLAALSQILGALEVSGVVQCFDNGGRFEAGLRVGGNEVASIGQMARDGRVGILFDDGWVSVDADGVSQAAVLLELNPQDTSLLSLDYGPIRRGDTPILTPVYDLGLLLWQFASPYAGDNGRLHVPSGATSHGTTYEIDTAAFRQVLGDFIPELSADLFSFGLPGTELSFGVDQAAFDGFVERLRAVAEGAELAKPIKLNMTFGEADVLRTARGSGTLIYQGKRSGISYSYSCSLSNTRITRKYSLDFEPTGSDTLNLTATFLTSSNNTKSGAQEVHLSASGIFDGKPYRLKIDLEMVNRYALDDQNKLSERITGTVLASLKVDGETKWNLSMQREGNTLSAIGQNKLTIDDLYQVTVKDDNQTMFEGQLSLNFSTTEQAEEVPDLTQATQLEALDFDSVEKLRLSLSEQLSRRRQELLTALPKQAMDALLKAF